MVAAAAAAAAAAAEEEEDGDEWAKTEAGAAAEAELENEETGPGANAPKDGSGDPAVVGAVGGVALAAFGTCSGSGLGEDDITKL